MVPKPIWLVLVLDQSEASKTRMSLGQRIARLLLSSLSEKDRVGLVLATDTTRVLSPPGTASSSQHGLDLYPAIQETKLVSRNYALYVIHIGVLLETCFLLLIAFWRTHLRPTWFTRHKNQPHQSITGGLPDNSECYRRSDAREAGGKGPWTSYR